MKRTRILIKRGGALVALTMALSLLPGTAWAQESGVDYTNTVTVAAGATVEIAADIATASFGVRAGNVDAAKAMSRVAAKTESVVAALRAAGVTDEELTVASVRLARRTDRRGNFLRYVATVAVKVKTQRLDALGAIIDAAVAGGASSLRLSYDVADRSAAVDRALREAMAFARAKATALAEAEGRTVGAAIVISEFDSRPPRAVSYDTAALGRTVEESGGSSLVPLAPPTLEARVHITVTFALV